MTYYVEPDYVEINYSDPSIVSIIDNILAESIAVIDIALDIKDQYDAVTVSEEVSEEVTNYLFNYIDLEVYDSVIVTEYVRYSAERLQIFVVDEILVVSNYTSISYVTDPSGSFLYFDTVELCAPELKVELIHANRRNITSYS